MSQPGIDVPSSFAHAHGYGQHAQFFSKEKKQHMVSIWGIYRYSTNSGTLNLKCPWCAFLLPHSRPMMVDSLHIFWSRSLDFNQTSRLAAWPCHHHTVFPRFSELASQDTMLLCQNNISSASSKFPGDKIWHVPAKENYSWNVLQEVIFHWLWFTLNNLPVWKIHDVLKVSRWHPVVIWWWWRKSPRIGRWTYLAKGGRETYRPILPWTIGQNCPKKESSSSNPYLFQGLC